MLCLSFPLPEILHPGHRLVLSPQDGLHLGRRILFNFATYGTSFKILFYFFPPCCNMILQTGVIFCFNVHDSKEINSMLSMNSMKSMLSQSFSNQWDAILFLFDVVTAYLTNFYPFPVRFFHLEFIETWFDKRTSNSFVITFFEGIRFLAKK